MGGAVSGLMGAQRLNMYGSLSSEVDIETVAAEATEQNLMMCKLGLFSGGVQGGSNLLNSTFNSTAVGDANDELNSSLLAALLDAALTLIIILATVTFLHILIILYWHYRMNRKFYASLEGRNARAVAEERAQVHKRLRSSAYVDSQAALAVATGINLREVLTTYDADNSGSLDLDEFERLVAQLTSFQQQQAAVTAEGAAVVRPSAAEAFARYDTNRSGDMDLAELRNCLMALGLQVDDEPRATEVLAKYDKDTSGDNGAPAQRRSAVKEMEAQEASLRFRPLPAALVFPNVQLTFGTALMTGVLNLIFVVFGTAAGNHRLDARVWVVASIAAILFTLFFTVEIRKLLEFRRMHVDKCWKPTEETGKTDDPILCLLAKLRLVRAGPRLRGEFEPPEGYNDAEPARTERAISRILCWASPAEHPHDPDAPQVSAAVAQAGLRYEQVSVWLDGCTGSVTYMMLGVMQQMALSFVMGLTMDLKNRISTAKTVAYVLVMVFQLVMAVLHLTAHKDDRLDGIVSAVVALFEFFSTALVFAATQYTLAGYPEVGLRLGLNAAPLMMVPVLMPLGLEIYDGIVVKTIEMIQEGRRAGDGWKAILITVAFMPIGLLMQVLRPT